MKFKFSFIYPLTLKTKDVQRREGISYIHMADLLVNGEAEKSFDAPDNPRFEIAIHEILFNEMNLCAYIEAIEPLANIKLACLNHLQSYHRGVINRRAKVIDFTSPRKAGGLQKIKAC